MSNDDSKTNQRDEVRAKVLEGADDVTRQKMDAMLEHSSVVELMAKAQQKGPGAEDQPIKPDFLDTEQYHLARRAIGAKGDAPHPSRAADREGPTWKFYVGVVAVLLLALVIVWPLLRADDDGERAAPTSSTTPTAPLTTTPTTTASAETPTPAPPTPTPSTETSVAPAPVPPPVSPPTPGPTGPRFPVQGED